MTTAEAFRQQELVRPFRVRLDRSGFDAEGRAVVTRTWSKELKINGYGAISAASIGWESQDVGTDRVGSRVHRTQVPAALLLSYRSYDIRSRLRSHFERGIGRRHPALARVTPSQRSDSLHSALRVELS